MHEEIVRILSFVPRAGMNGLVRKNCIPSFVLATRLVWLRHRCCNQAITPTTWASSGAIVGVVAMLRQATSLLRTSRISPRFLETGRIEWLGEKVSYGCETSLHSDIRLAVCHRWLWLCAPAPSRNLHRDHARIQRPSPSLLVAPRLSAIFGACRLFFYSRTARNIDRAR